VSALLRGGANPVMVDAQPNTTVLLFTVAVSVLTGIAFGLAPAFAAARVDVTPALKGFTVAWRGRRRLARQGLVATQIALCLVLVFGAGLLVRTLQNLRTVEAGFRKDGLVTFQLDARDTLFPAGQLPALCADVLERLGRRPGVVSGTCSTMTPVNTMSVERALTVPGFTPGPDSPDFAYSNSVDSDYFRTLGIELVSGRAFTAQDTAASPQVAIVAESVARHYFRGVNPIGRTFQWGRRDPGPPIAIVGVVRDTRQSLREPPPHMIYTPLSQRWEAPDDLLAAVRTTGATSALAPAVREDLLAVNRNVALRYVRSMDEQFDAALVAERLLASLSTAFAALALLLACVGLYGVMSYEVSRRTRDLGIRLALGARRAAVLRGVLGRVAIITAVGLAIGAFGTSIVSNAVSALLFEIEPRDLATLAWSAAALLGTALLAGYFPARRAARVDPAAALRME
jgi:predicted permease